MIIANSMESYAARLASFNAPHVTTKKRSSDARGAKQVKWPHKHPSPPQLARAGFFYQPTTSCPDNTQCYLCQSNLDGWEKDDSAVEEHLKHAPSCGWAVAASIEQSIEDGSHDMEDPMSEAMRNARHMTFGTNWPHEGKRGWKCKTQRMVDSGWHFCPTLESDDFVKCSYCSLSLDGWDPKDNPYDEHQRRSPDCMFFTFSISKPKAGRTKKGRASNVSRLSTQSNLTEGASVAETEDNFDESILSTADASRTGKSGKGGKKAPKPEKAPGRAKGKAVKAKQEESQMASSFLEPEDDDFEVKVAQAPTSDEKSKKRKSEEISISAGIASHPHADEKFMEPQPPPNKRRATKTRNSVAQAQEAPIATSRDEVEVDSHMMDAEDMPSNVPAPRKKGKSGKKRASSNARKVSTASTASKASLRAAIPDDEEIDAALDADLNRPLADEESDKEPIEVEQPKSRRLTRSKPGSKKTTASAASTRRGTRASTVARDDSAEVDLYPSIPHALDSERGPTISDSAQSPALEEHTESLPKAKNAKTKVSRKVSKQEPNKEQPIPKPEEDSVTVDEPASQDVIEIAEPQPRKSRQVSRQLPVRRTRASDMPISQAPTDVILDVDSSVLAARTMQDESGHETDASTLKQGRSKRGSRKPPSGVKKTKAGRKPATTSHNIEDIVVPTSAEQEGDKQDDQPNVVVHVAPNNGDNGQHVSIDIEIPNEHPKATKASARVARAKKSAPKSNVAAPKAPEASSPAQPSSITEVRDEPTVSSPPSVHSTPRPAPSPQSSDAENQPPSSRPSSLRPPLSMQSPSRSQTTRVPLANTTPTTSPSRGNFSKLQSTFPWTAVDLEQIFQASPSPEKENRPFVFGKALAEGALPSPEKKLSVEQWVQFNAQRGEEKLRSECERLVGNFESQGMRALKTLEGIVTAE